MMRKREIGFWRGAITGLGLALICVFTMAATFQNTATEQHWNRLGLKSLTEMIDNNFAQVETNIANLMQLASGTLLVGQTNGFATERTPAGDVTMTVSGVFTVVDNAVLASELGAGILASDVIYSNQAGELAGSNVTLTAGGVVVAGDDAIDPRDFAGGPLPPDVVYSNPAGELVASNLTLTAGGVLVAGPDAIDPLDLAGGVLPSGVIYSNPAGEMVVSNLLVTPGGSVTLGGNAVLGSDLAIKSTVADFGGFTTNEQKYVFRAPYACTITAVSLVSDTAETDLLLDETNYTWTVSNLTQANDLGDTPMAVVGATNNFVADESFSLAVTQNVALAAADVIEIQVSRIGANAGGLGSAEIRCFVDFR